MRTTWRDGGVAKAVTAPVSLIVSAFAPVRDARRALTPQLRLDRGDTVLVLIDLGTDAPPRRLGTGAGVRPARQRGARRRRSGAARRVLRARSSALHATAVLLAYHDIGDGGLVRDARARWRSRRAAGSTSTSTSSIARCAGARCSPKSSARSCRCDARTRRRASQACARRGLAAITHRPAGRGQSHAHSLRRARRARRVAHRSASRVVGDDARDAAPARQPGVRADQEYARLLDDARSRPRRRSSRSTPTTTSRRRSLRRGARPARRDPARAGRQRPGRDGRGVRPRRVRRVRRAHERHHRRTPCACAISRASSRAAGSPTATCWAPAKAGRSRSCSTRALRDEFAAFFARGDTFALGVCNGCQMMSNLHEHHPRRRALAALRAQPSEQFEARFVMLEVLPSPSLFFARHGRQPHSGRDGARRRATPNSAMRAQLAAAQPLVALRFVDHRGRATETLSVQSERLAAGHHRPHDRRRPLHDPDAASGARVPHGADVVASATSGARRRRGCGCSATRAVRRLSCAAEQQRTRVTDDDALTVYSIDGVTPVVDPTAYRASHPRC